MPRTFCVCLASLVFAALPASASYLDLTLTGAPVGSTGQGAFGSGFFQSGQSPTTVGTGNIDSFVQIQKNGNEEAVNTNARKNDGPGIDVLDMGSSANFNHAIQLSQLMRFDANGTQNSSGAYYRFLLDINQNQGGVSEFLSLDQLRLGYGSAGNLHVSSGGVFGGTTGITEVYDIDDEACSAGANASCSGSFSGNGILLNYANNKGSGNGFDMFFYVPVNEFAGVGSNAYVYLYSQFGTQEIKNGSDKGKWGANDGFEEWAIDALVGDPPHDPVPEPGFYGLLSIGVAGVFAAYRRRNRVQA